MTGYVKCLIFVSVVAFQPLVEVFGFLFSFVVFNRLFVLKCLNFVFVFAFLEFDFFFFLFLLFAVFHLSRSSFFFSEYMFFLVEKATANGFCVEVKHVPGGGIELKVKSMDWGKIKRIRRNYFEYGAHTCAYLFHPSPTHHRPVPSWMTLLLTVREQMLRVGVELMDFLFQK